MKMKDNLQELTKAFREGSIVPERSGEYWSPDEREELESLYRAGEGISEIALQFQRSELAVMQQLLTAGLMTSPQASRPKRSKKLKCRCGSCPFNPSGCETVCYCTTEEAYA